MPHLIYSTAASRGLQKLRDFKQLTLKPIVTPRKLVKINADQVIGYALYLRGGGEEMLPSSKRRRRHIASAAASLFLLWSFPADASLISLVSTAAGAVDAGPEPPRNLSALEHVLALGNQDQATPERPTGDLPPADLGQSLYVGTEPGSSMATTRSAHVEPARRETLRQVVRSIVTIHSFQQRQRYGPPRAAPRDRSGSDETTDDGEKLGLAELLLDSEVVGALARQLVEIRTADGDGTIFSVLGLGEFVLDLTPNDHAAVLTELSSGLSVGTPLAGAYSVYANYGLNGEDSRTPREKVNLFRLVADWVVDAVLSPVGILASMVAGIVLILWLCMKSVKVLQGRRAAR